MPVRFHVDSSVVYPYLKDPDNYCIQLLAHKMAPKPMGFSFFIID